MKLDDVSRRTHLAANEEKIDSKKKKSLVAEKEETSITQPKG